MFEGYIAGKFANKMFEKEVFKIVKRHAFWGSLIMALPTFGLGIFFYISILWRMYSKIADKVGVSFADNLTKLIGVGIIVNLIVAFAIDLVMSFIPFLEPFMMYLQFYSSGKLFIESLKKLK